MRKTGIRKGKPDIYLVTPCGRTLRSNKELEQYCDENHLEINSKANFSTRNTYQGLVTFRLKSSANESQIDEALVTEVIIPKSPNQTKSLAESAKRGHE